MLAMMSYDVAAVESLAPAVQTLSLVSQGEECSTSQDKHHEVAMVSV